MCVRVCVCVYSFGSFSVKMLLANMESVTASERGRPALGRIERVSRGDLTLLAVAATCIIEQLLHI